MYRPPGIFVSVLAWIVTAWASVAVAQVSDVEVSVNPNDIGLGGAVRPGSFTPMLVTMQNRSANPRRVRCRWIMPDIDGDPIVHERTVTLSPKRTQQAWLYAAPPYSTPLRNPEWRVELVDDGSGKLIGSTKLQTNDLIETQVNLIGIAGSRSMGLRRFSSNETRHEPNLFILGLDPGRLPDRWYGLASLQALVWTPDSADPSAPSVSPETIKAIREWVRRGGHLVVMLPTIGEDLWLNSPIGDMLPNVDVTTKRSVQPPTKLGVFKRVSMDLKILRANDGKSTIIFEEDGDPWVVARQFGFGRVTLVGVDLSSLSLARQDIPKGGDFWAKIFAWQDLAHPLDVKLAQENARLSYTDNDDLGDFVRPAIAMRETFASSMLLAILLFILYWLAAGPVGFTVLKFRGYVRHAWMVFVAVVMVFSAISWGGAMLVRPHRSDVSHVTLLDIDAATDTVHAHSWLSLFVARHGRVNLAVDADTEGANRSTVSTAGQPALQFESVFLDPQRYSIQSAAPHEVSVPYRSTAKLFEIDYFGELGNEPVINGVQWVMPQPYRLRVVNGFPEGQISHNMPGTLKWVLAVYATGEGEVWLWQQGEWKPNQIMNVRRPDDVKKLWPLVRKGRTGKDQSWDGYLHERIDKNSKVIAAIGERIAGNQLVSFTELLSFYSALPPPEYWKEGMQSSLKRYYRSVGREFDLTHLLNMRRLILIGYMQDSPLPVPIQVDGQPIKGKGWTVVRWIYPID